MNNSGYIQTAKNPDLTTFKVMSGGTELPGKYGVKSILVEKEVNRIPYARIVILDGSVPEQDFKLSNEELLIPGKEIEITAGYHSEEETIFKGVVVKHNIKVRSSSSYLIIECRDKAVKMTLGRKSKYFYDSKDSDIIEELIANSGAAAEVEATSNTHKELVQYQASDWDFMLTRAQANGKLCFVEDGTVKVAKPNFSGEAVETVVFGSSVHEFDGEIDARDQFNKITAKTWNYTDQELTEVEAQDPAISLNGNLSSGDLAKVFGIEDLQLKHGGNLTQEELQHWGDAKATFQQLAKTRGRVKFQGIPLEPGVTLMLQGVGNRFNGKIYVTGVRHEIVDGNWLVDAQFGLSPTWFSEAYDVSEMPGSGIIPAISGLHVGIVSQLESDPDGEDRILVQIPIINNEEEGIWARVATLDAGENRGSFFRPEIGDEVIIGFINDDPNDAVVLGMLNSSTKPAPIVASDDNHEKGFVTRSEMKMIFNDDKISYTLETPKGKKVIVDEDADIIKIEDEHANTFTLNKDGISMESSKDIKIKAKGDINMEGVNINVKASAQLKAEGSSGSELKSGAVTVVKGSQVKIN
ncbi:type VI secretion system tip protein VgrG [Chryseobacterium shandongense]|uniref:Type VI secretion system tip protein VgrG n=1 Tax=Chryseobacterium shandongense TaxID=1493872 RepID=A0AAD0YG12_9FLAO|nr:MULTISPECIES: type VI secretion system tip protein VgrG [Chryseobacterium]AZA88770.1 type VI secretion system tip protein VgrG [Chryseobacterium shandongense]AZA97313.1 type VI secretion system tip protein VgrG [Chryseobacterium shandongense]